MLSNAYFLAKFRFDIAENEPAKNLQNLQKIGNFPNFADHSPPNTGAALAAKGLPLAEFHALPLREALAVLQAEAVAEATRRPIGKISAKFRQNVSSFRLYRHRFLQENMRFAAFFKICQII